MARYIGLRFMSMVVTVLLVLTITFAVSRMLPGSVAYARLGETATDEQIEEMEAALGLDRPWYDQYFRWAGDAVRFDFGESLTVPDLKVSDEIRTRLPITIELAFLSLLVSCVIGIPVGVISALRQDSWIDYVLRVMAILGLAVPTFWLLTLMIAYTAAWWSWLPPVGYRPIYDDPWANLQQFALPAAVLGFSLSAPIMRITRSTMLEAIRSDYIRTARAKGLSGQVVITRHALRNALIPVVTILGLQMGNLLGGTVIIESVAGLPGLGRLMVDTITRRDYTMLQGVVVVVATFTVFSNFLVDLAYVYIDPRIKNSFSAGGN